MRPQDAKIWKYVVKKIPGTYGETDWDKKIISVNKQYHKSKGNHRAGVRKNKDGSANITDTILHEIEHKNHPKMYEKNIKKLTRKRYKKLGRKSKQKLLAKLK